MSTMPSATATRALTLTIEQIAALRQAADDRCSASHAGPDNLEHQTRDLLEIVLGTGMHLREALALRLEDVYETPEGLVLRICGDTVPLIRWAFIPAFAVDVLRCRTHGAAADPAGRLFSAPGGGPIPHGDVTRMMKKFVSAAGLADSGITFATLRRTVALVLIRSVGAEAATEHLGRPLKRV